MNSTGSESFDSLCQLVTSQQNLICSCSHGDVLVAFGTAGGDDPRSRMMRQLDSTSPNSSSAALHQNRLASNGICKMNRPMSRDARNTQAGTLLQRHTFR